MRLIIFFIALILAIPVFGEVLFEDNFDDCSANCTVNVNGAPAGWYEWHAQGGVSANINGETHYFGEITSPGRGEEGKSLKVWRNGTTGPTHDDFTGVLHYLFSGTYNHIYFRYYIKLPTELAFNGSDACYVKSWRFNTSGGSGEMHGNFNGCDDMRTNGSFQFYDGVSWHTLIDNTALRSIWDGNWHSLQFNIDIGASDLQVWVDGVQTYSNTSFSFSATGNFQGLQHFAVGNYSSSSSWQSSWQAIEFDDFIISTTYIEPEGEPTCDSSHLELCTTQEICEGASLNWCDGACQVAECPAAETATISGMTFSGMTKN